MLGVATVSLKPQRRAVAKRLAVLLERRVKLPIPRSVLAGCGAGDVELPLRRHGSRWRTRLALQRLSPFDGFG